MAMQTGPGGKVDRHTTSPFHLKLFYRVNSFHRLEEFSPTSGGPLPPFVELYTWPSCTLRELSHLFISELPNVVPYPAIGTRLSYRLIFPDTRETGRPGPGYLSKDLGYVILGGDERRIFSAAEADNADDGDASGGAADLNGDANKTLQDARFVIGDYISCVIVSPPVDGSMHPPPGGLTARPGGGVIGRVTGEFGTGGGGGPRGGSFGAPRENGFGGIRGRGGLRGAVGFSGRRLGDGGLPTGEWRRGERLPDGPGARGYGRGRARGF